MVQFDYRYVYLETLFTSKTFENYGKITGFIYYLSDENGFGLL